MDEEIEVQDGAAASNNDRTCRRCLIARKMCAAFFQTGLQEVVERRSRWDVASSLRVTACTNGLERGDSGDRNFVFVETVVILTGGQFVAVL